MSTDFFIDFTPDNPEEMKKKLEKALKILYPNSFSDEIDFVKKKKDGYILGCTNGFGIIDIFLSEAQINIALKEEAVFQKENYRIQTLEKTIKSLKEEKKRSEKRLIKEKEAFEKEMKEKVDNQQELAMQIIRRNELYKKAIEKAKEIAPDNDELRDLWEQVLEDAKRIS